MNSNAIVVALNSPNLGLGLVRFIELLLRSTIVTSTVGPTLSDNSL